MSETRATITKENLAGLIEDQNNGFFRIVKYGLEPCMIVFIPIQPFCIHRGDCADRVGNGVSDCIAVVDYSKTPACATAEDVATPPVVSVYTGVMLTLDGF